MPTQKSSPKLLYSARTPPGWLRVAAAGVEQKPKAPVGWHAAPPPPATGVPSGTGRPPRGARAH